MLTGGVDVQEFLSTPSARRATAYGTALTAITGYFYPRPPRGGRLCSSWASTRNRDFYPRPPRGGRLKPVLRASRVAVISIHALREEGDWTLATQPPKSSNFYPRPPRGGRPSLSTPTSSPEQISIHALREEGDEEIPYSKFTVKISIHALREEGDVSTGVQYNMQMISIHALREEGDVVSSTKTVQSSISIHALREEGDLGKQAPGTVVLNFYPRPPRGGRRAAPAGSWPAIAFLSTPSARRATSDTPLRWNFLPYFYPRPPRGGRRSSRKARTHSIYFYPRPPRGGRLRGGG